MLMSRRATILVLAGLAIFGATRASAQLRPRVQPLIVRFVGVFHPFNEKEAGNLHTLTVSYKKHHWLFQVERVNVLGGSDPGTMVLNRIFPPRLSFSGPPKLLEPLGSPENMGKRITLEGQLYLKDRRFSVASVKEETTTDPEKQEDER